MPAIKKRITAEYLEREQQRSEQNGSSAADVEGDKENPSPSPVPPPVTAAGAASTSPLKRKAQGTQRMLTGLDGEVLVEKRKRTLPPGELKLDAWLDNNLEKRADSALSLVRLYQLYTDMCQQDASNVVELDVFKTMLRNKFGKEFGLKEGSAYSGLLKKTKPRKKTVVAQSLGYKMKDIIEETLKASGNPTKGMVFAWLKKFIAAKYPALQIEFRPHFLRRALEREIGTGRVELVKGIGFCGYYRQPGPPTVEEEPKAKKKGAKKGKQGEESAESADDVAVETDKDEEEKSKEKGNEKGDEAKEKTTEKDKKKKSQGKEDGGEGTAEEKEGDEEKKDDKKPKKKRRRAPVRRPSSGTRHGNPQMLNDVFPLAMTYMAEPKEASFGRIRKYLEKFYNQVDIDSKLKRCIEHGCDTGLWDRVSGSGASGSFQLQVDSFNPEHTESMTDMICSAIIACNEPKTSSVKLLKSYISEYHPEFNIDTRPHKLKNALERAEKQNQLRRVSGIGMTGSFQLVEQFTPSPSILAGEDVEEESDYEEPAGKSEVYVVRKTKSGRRAPLERTQLDYSSPKKKKSGAGGGAKGKKKLPQKKARQRSQYAEVSSEEESSSSEEEADSDQEGYHPRPSKSRGGGGGRTAPAKPTQKRAAPKASSKAAVTKKRAKPATKTQKPTKRGKRATPQKIQVKEEDSEEEEEKEEEKSVYTPRPTKSGRNANGSTPLKSPAKKKGRTPKAPAPVSDDEEQYFEVEEEAPTPKKGRAGKGATTKSPAATPAQKRSAKRGATVTSTPAEGRTPRSALRTGRQSYKEVDSDEADDEDYVTPLKTSRVAKRR